MASRIIVAVLIVAAGMGVFFWMQMKKREKEAVRDLEEMQLREAERAARRRHELAAPPPTRATPIATHGRTAQEIDENRRRYAALQRQIASAQSSAAGHPGDEPAGSLDKDYIQGRVHELVPLMKECYELARVEQPALAGRMTVAFKISGVPGVGGVVDRAEVMRNGPTPDGGMPPNATLDECMKATVESLTFDPPKGGGTVTVHYPFVFATIDADAGAQ